MILDGDVIDEAVAAHKHYWGVEHYNRVVDQLLEEMAELSVELLKRRRKDERSTRPDNTRLEIFDVLICLEFLGRYEAISEHEAHEMVGNLAGGLRLALTMAADMRDGKTPHPTFASPHALLGHVKREARDSRKH